ncbi:MAG: T9SS type A sorting domain-containing protein [Clostridia bacterium]|nr:T9SS type A sorting domain-containing protein [Clostridia bacterium]
MYYKILFTLVAFYLSTYATTAQWQPLQPAATAGSAPEVTLLSQDASGAVLQITLPGFEIKTFETDGAQYQRISIMGETYTHEAGLAEVPYLAEILAVPDNASIEVEVIETGEVKTFRDISLPPARESWWEGDAETPYQENRAAYANNALYPAVAAQTEAPAIFRDFRIVRVSMFPFRYNAATKELRVATTMKVRVTFGTGEAINPKISARKPIAPSFGTIYRSFIFNYQQVLNELYGGREEGHELMLCIMPDEFTTSFQVFADWKRQSGTDIHITKFSDIGANANNPDIIKNHISDAWYNWETPPTYVLIVGDEGVFPHKIVSYPSYSFPNEDFFVEVEGNDYFPEMMIGRFTNQADYRMQVIINKNILYETAPYTDDETWFRKGTCCSNNDYDSQVETKRFTAEAMLTDGNFLQVDTLMSDGSGWGYNCSMDVDDIINALNNGRSYLNYRGEGWYSGWQASCYNFNTDDVSSLNNGQKFTFITSIGCGVAGFHSNGGNCFGEEWLQLGSLTAPRGGVAFIGPTSNTHTTYNNRIDKGIYEGMFREGMDTPGQALLRGKLYMYNVFGNEYYVEYHYKVFTTLGDPSVHIWKDTPRAVSVVHPEMIPVGNNELAIVITHTGTGLPVNNAQVTITSPDIFVSAFSDITGTAHLNLMPLAEGALTITVRGGNVIPYQATINVVQPDELVEPEGTPEVTDMTGNGDGFINPGENCSISVNLKNWGTLTVNNIQATLSTTDPEIEIITTGAISYGNIAPNATASGEPFMFSVSPACQVGHDFQLQLDVTSSLSSWTYYYTLKVHGCQLMMDSFILQETGVSNSNYLFEPGETAEMMMAIENFGDDIAPGVMGMLTTTDPYLTILDAEAAFGGVVIDGQAINEDDFFKISAAANCPTNYLANCSLRLFTTNGNYPYEISLPIQIPIAKPVAHDYTGPDAYGYYAYSSTDIFYDQSPVYDWLELSGIGTPVIIPGVSDYTQAVTLPFSFKYYGVNYNQLRISTDGWIAFGNGSQTAPVNQPLPAYDNVNAMTAAFWDDLYDIELAEGKLLYYHDVDEHRFIIEWDSIAHNDAGTEPKREVFQAVLYDPVYYPTTTGDGEIVMQYKKVTDALSNTIGIENHTQDIGLQYVFNNNYAATANIIKNYTAVKFTTEPPFVSLMVGIGDHVGGASSAYLYQNTPNPFSTSTTLKYELSRSGQILLQIFDINSALVKTLAQGKQAAGMHTVVWDGTTNTGSRAGTGMYFYRLQTDDGVQTLKLMLSK